MNRSVTGIVIICSLLVCSSTARCQGRPRPYSRLSLSYLFSDWSQDTDTGSVRVSEGVLGMRLNQRLGPGFSFDLTGTVSHAGYSDPVNNDIGFTALNDTRMRGTWHLGGRSARVSLLLNLPTGTKDLSRDQYLVALAISDNSRRYIVRRFGQGLDVGGEFFWTPRYDAVGFRLGGGYLRKGAYRVRQTDAGDYKFGNEAYGQIGFGVNARPVSFSAAVTVKTYTADERDSRSVYKAGNSVFVNARLTYSGPVWLSGGVRVLTRAKAEIPTAGTGNLTEEALKSGRDEWVADLNASLPTGERLRLLGRFEHKRITANDYDRTAIQYRPEADYTGFGAGFTYRLSLYLSGSVLASYYTGTVDSSYDLSGSGVNAAINLRYW